MKSMIRMMVILMATLFSLFFISESSFAQIYKWVDEKGTVNFTDDPNKVPVKYRTTVDTLDINPRESPPPTLSVRPETKSHNYLKASPDSPRKETTHSLSPSRGHHDLSNDRDYQEMLKKIGESQYYQRDYYTPRSGVPHARRGEIDPGAEMAARELKANIDNLVKDPRWGTSSEYRDEVKKYFKGHFNEKDEYYRNTGTVRSGAGEIKVPRAEPKQTPPIPIQKPPPPPSGLIGTRSGAIDSQTGDFYKGVKGGVINPRTGEFMRDVGGGYIDPSTGRFIPKQ